MFTLYMFCTKHPKGNNDGHPTQQHVIGQEVCFMSTGQRIFQEAVPTRPELTKHQAHSCLNPWWLPVCCLTFIGMVEAQQCHSDDPKSATSKQTLKFDMRAVRHNPDFGTPGHMASEIVHTVGNPSFLARIPLTKSCVYGPDTGTPG